MARGAPESPDQLRPEALAIVGDATQQEDGPYLLPAATVKQWLERFDALPDGERAGMAEDLAIVARRLHSADPVLTAALVAQLVLFAEHLLASETAARDLFDKHGIDARHADTTGQERVVFEDGKGQAPAGERGLLGLLDKTRSQR